MEENKELDVQTEGLSVQKPIRTFLSDLLVGACIGIAFIIPGFSGGSVAALLGVYEKLVNAVANIFKEKEHSHSSAVWSWARSRCGILALSYRVYAIEISSPDGVYLRRFSDRRYAVRD